MAAPPPPPPPPPPSASPAAAMAVSSEEWLAKKAAIRAHMDFGQNIEAMKLIMQEMRSFAERLDIHTLSVDTSAYYKNPAAFGTALKAIAEAEGVAEAERRVRPHEVAHFAGILAERGRAFLALAQPQRALQDLAGAVEIHGSGLGEEMHKALEAAKEQVSVAQEEERRREHARKVPVVVLTGFLGAGKTTLLNHILRARHGMRIAVIENEVGQIGIDNQLIDGAAAATRTEETVTLLDNGCLCCTVRSDLIAAVGQILDRAEAAAANRLAAAGASGVNGASVAGASEPPLDAIVIETTGLADPGPVCKTFYAEDALRERTRVDGVLTVVDAVHFLRQVRRERSDGAVNESAQQVGFADRVLLNKVDAVASEAELEAVEAEIRNINAACPIVRCSLSTQPEQVPLDELLGTDSFCLDRVLLDLATSSDAADGAAGAIGGEPAAKRRRGLAPLFCQPRPLGAQSRHDAGVATCAFTLAGAPLVLERFMQVMNTLRAEKAVDLYRYKGCVCIKESSGVVKRAVLQGVHDMCQFEPRGRWPEGEPFKSQLVFIGRSLDEALWGRLFEKTKEGVLDAK